MAGSATRTENFIQRLWRSLTRGGAPAEKMTQADLAKLGRLLGESAPKAAQVAAAQSPDTEESMITAAYEGRLDVVRRLVDKRRSAGRSAETLDMRSGCTPLMMASQQGHLAVVEFLLANGADARAQAMQGATSLMLASQNGHPEVVKVLIEKGYADMAAKMTDGRTALKMAMQYGHADVVALLRKYGADE